MDIKSFLYILYGTADFPQNFWAPIYLSLKEVTLYVGLNVLWGFTIMHSLWAIFKVF
jgi:hypothetical protein